MTSPALLLAPLLAVTFGYEPSSNSPDGYDYIVQVEPELVEQLRTGDAPDIEVTIPPEVTPIKRIRLVVGTDTLPRTLNPTIRTTFKPEIDASSTLPPIDLLAQTGPAGGFGRNATGFQRGPAISSGQGAQTVPPVRGGTLGQVGRDLDAGFENARENWATARDSLRSGVNNAGNAGQEFVDRTRRLVGDVVTPPQREPVDANGRPLQNLAGRVQEDLQDTANAVRGAFDTRQYRETATRDRYRNQESSVLAADRNGGVGRDQRTPLTPAQVEQQQREYNMRLREERLRTEQLARQEELRQEQERLEQLRLENLRLERQREQQLAAERRERETNLAAQDDRSTTLPNQTGLRPLPGREGVDERGSGIVQPLVGRSERGNRAPTADDDWSNEEIEARSREREMQTVGRFAGPVLEAADGSGQAEIDRPAWMNDKGQADQNAGRDKFSQADYPPSNGNTSRNSNAPLWLLGSVIAIGSVVLNLFQWLNIVDMRNKYRVALRRTSPGFTRSMAA